MRMGGSVNEVIYFLVWPVMGRRKPVKSEANRKRKKRKSGGNIFNRGDRRRRRRRRRGESRK